MLDTGFAGFRAIAEALGQKNRKITDFVTAFVGGACHFVTVLVMRDSWSIDTRYLALVRGNLACPAINLRTRIVKVAQYASVVGSSRAVEHMSDRTGICVRHGTLDGRNRRTTPPNAIPSTSR